MTMDLEFEFKLDEINSFLMKNLLLSQLFYMFQKFLYSWKHKKHKKHKFFLCFLCLFILTHKNCLHSNLKLNKFISNSSLNTQKILSGNKTSKYLLVKNNKINYLVYIED